MNRTVRSLAVGMALSVACVACTAGEGGSDASPPPSPQATPLQKLDELSLSGDPMAEQDAELPVKERRPIGETRIGSNRIIAYVEGSRCGLLVIDSKGSVSISLETQWPQDASQGSSRLPAGPYNSTSAPGTNNSDPWASLSCGKNSMIIEYTSRVPGHVSAPRGSMEVVDNSQKNHTRYFVVVGSEAVRTEISNGLSV